MRLFWGQGFAATSISDLTAVMGIGAPSHDAALLLDSAAALTGFCGRAEPLGCMVTLSAAGSEGPAERGELVRTARAQSLKRVTERLHRAVA